MTRHFNYRPLIVIAVLVGAWQWALGGGTIVSDTLAAPGPVLVALVKLLFDGSALAAILATVETTLLGLAIGSAIGVLLGLLGGMIRPFAAVLHGPVEVLRPLPAIALVPLFTIVLGLGLKMETIVVAWAVTWPSIILSQTAVRNVDRELNEVASLLEFNFIQRSTKILLPAVWPRLVVMLRFTGAIALLIAVTVELVQNPRGLGHEMMMASWGFAAAEMLAYLVIITIIGWLLNWILLRIERWASPSLRLQEE